MKNFRSRFAAIVKRKVITLIVQIRAPANVMACSEWQHMEIVKESIVEIVVLL